MKPCGGCAKRREQLKAIARKVIGRGPKTAPPKPQPKQESEPARE